MTTYQDVLEHGVVVALSGALSLGIGEQLLGHVHQQVKLVYVARQVDADTTSVPSSTSD